MSVFHESRPCDAVIERMRDDVAVRILILEPELPEWK